jgi:nucleotide-binding universal stress UspA family protein
MRILAAIDGSEPATRALEFAARMTKALKGHLKIVHVISENDVPEEKLREYAITEHATSAEVLNGFSQAKLKSARERVEALGVTDADSASLLELHRGAVAETIMDAASQDETDVIVMGKRGLGRLSGLLVGSVSQNVVSAAHCAVIVVP